MLDEVLGDGRFISALEYHEDKPDQEDVFPEIKAPSETISKIEHDHEKDPTRNLNDTAVYVHDFSSFGSLLILTTLVLGLMWGFFWNAGTLFLRYWA